MKISKEGPPGRYQYDWDEIVKVADANPGEWIKPEREYPHSVYTAISRGKNRYFPPGKYEFRTSGNRYDIDGKRLCYLHIRRVVTNEKEVQA